MAGQYAHLALSENGFLFDTVTGHTFTLNKTGTFIVRRLMEGADPGEIPARLAEAFEVDLEVAGRDVASFVQRLADTGVGRRD